MVISFGGDLSTGAVVSGSLSIIVLWRKLAWAHCFEVHTCVPLSESNNSKVRKRCRANIGRSASAQNARTSHYNMLAGNWGQTPLALQCNRHTLARPNSGDRH